MLFNTTLLSLSTAGILASPFIMPPSMSSLHRFSFSHLVLNRHISTFFSNFRDRTIVNFQNSAFIHFLDSAIIVQDVNFVNSTFTTQKSITSFNDVNFIDCIFQFCMTKSQGGAIFASSTNIARFSIKSTSFYNCNAMSNGAILLNQVQELIFDMICFNRCTATIANQAGLISCTMKNSINSVSIYLCPFISKTFSPSGYHRSDYSDHNTKNTKNNGRKKTRNNIYGKKNSIVFKGTTFIMSSINSSFNENYDRGVIMQLHNIGTSISTSNFVNNTGIDGFSIYNNQLYIATSTFAGNTFYVAPFQSFSSNNNRNPTSFSGINDNFPNVVYIKMAKMNYFGNLVNPNHDFTNRVEGDIQVDIYDSYSDVNKILYPFGIGASIKIFGIDYFQSFTYSYSFFQTQACYHLDEHEESPDDDDDIRTKRLIVYLLLASCGIVVVVGCSILVVTHFQKRRSLRNWIEENEDRIKDDDNDDNDTEDNGDNDDADENGMDQYKKRREKNQDEKIMMMNNNGQKEPFFNWKKSGKISGGEKKNAFSSMRIPIPVTNYNIDGNSINKSMLGGKIDF